MLISPHNQQQRKEWKCKTLTFSAASLFGNWDWNNILVLGSVRWQGKLESTALRFGLVGNICLTLLFFPVARGSSVLPLFGLTSEASIKYHIWLGHMVMTLFTAHGVCYIIFWAVTNNISEVIILDTFFFFFSLLFCLLILNINFCRYCFPFLVGVSPLQGTGTSYVLFSFLLKRVKKNNQIKDEATEFETSLFS